MDLVKVGHVLPGQEQGVPGGNPGGDDGGVVPGQVGVAHQEVELVEGLQGSLEILEARWNVEARYISKNLKKTAMKKPQNSNFLPPSCTRCPRRWSRGRSPCPGGGPSGAPADVIPE